MNVDTGQIYPTMRDALNDLSPGQTEKDVVEVIGSPEAVEELSRSIQQLRAIERRRAKNKAAKATRRQQRH